MDRNQQSSADHVIEFLKGIDVDGETMQYIIDQVGMHDQMLKQLIMSSSDLHINNCLEEREELLQNDSLKAFWRNVRNNESNQ